jgi:light-regulated signal transduction histidine kinase (bacteriophytochrome)
MSVFKAVDLQSCDREPIHLPGAIQPHAALLALDPRSWCIAHAAGASLAMLGARPAALLGRDIVEVLGGERSLQLRQQVENEPPLLRPVHICTMLAPRGGALLDVIAHRNSQGSIIVEFERHDGPQPDDAMAAVQMMIRGLQRAEDTGQLCRAAASVVRGITGYDRVMVYQFLPDGSGAVVAEARDPQADSFLGLHYPPSDIPAQARALYLANWIRTIPDSRYAPMKLVSARGRRTGPALDLSHAVSRSVSPIHRQYLVNMGVAASLSLSLVVQGQLLGADRLPSQRAAFRAASAALHLRALRRSGLRPAGDSQLRRAFRRQGAEHAGARGAGAADEPECRSGFGAAGRPRGFAGFHSGRRGGAVERGQIPRLWYHPQHGAGAGPGRLAGRDAT